MYVLSPFVFQTKVETNYKSEAVDYFLKLVVDTAVCVCVCVCVCVIRSAG